MKVLDYKYIFNCFKCEKSTVFSSGDEVMCECGNEISFYTLNFKTKEHYDEFIYFKEWQDESQGNYVGYSRLFKKFTILVSRDYAGVSGLFTLTKIEIENTSEKYIDLTLKDIKLLMRKYIIEDLNLIS
jgi:hypothetical protein